MINFLIKKFDVLILFSLFSGCLSFFFLYQFSWVYEFCGEYKYFLYAFISYLFLVFFGELFVLGVFFLFVNIFKPPQRQSSKKLKTP